MNFGSDGQPAGGHLLFGKDGSRYLSVAGNTAFDTSTGTMYTRAGSSVFGTDGSVHQVLGGNPGTVLGSDGSVHLVQRNGDTSFIL